MRTGWSTENMSYWIYKTRERIEQKIAWMLPKQIVMWAFARVFAHATTGEHEKTNAGDLLAIEAMNRWPGRV